VLGLAGDAPALALACRDMAERSSRGGRLLVFGNGAGATDAQLVALEFMHPVIVGKRALPALSLVSDAATLMGVAGRRGLEGVYAHQVEVLGRPDDIALGLSSDGRCANVRAGLQAAREAGLLTVALLGGDGGDLLTDGAVDHRLVVRSDDPLVVKKGHVTLYHLLWELVHVFFDSPEVSPPQQPASGVEQLYPFLYGGGPTPLARWRPRRSRRARRWPRSSSCAGSSGSSRRRPSRPARRSSPVPPCWPSATAAAAPTRRTWSTPSSTRRRRRIRCLPWVAPTTSPS